MVGVCILLGSLAPVGQLIKQLPSGTVRRSWYVMAALIDFFVVGYIGYIAAFWGHHSDWLALIVPNIFFLGASFVWLTAKLSLQTVADIRRVVLLEQENITDPLLGIYNRRYMDRRLKEEFKRAQRFGTSLSVMLVDIDHFKFVNDNYGHQVGDQVLSYLGKLILSVIREVDVAARYGGEELLIIATDTAASCTVALAERLRQHIEAHTLALSNQTHHRLEIRITVSIGVAGLDPEVTDPVQLVSNADQALYRAKREGRNRVILYQPFSTSPDYKIHASPDSRFSSASSDTIKDLSDNRLSA